jgi:hypothetical protein
LTRSLPALAILVTSEETGGKELEMIRRRFRFRRLVLGLAVGLTLTVASAPAVQAKPISPQPPLQAATPSRIAPDVRDHRLVRQYVLADRGPSQSGFDWGDAGIGAAVTFGAGLCLLTAVGIGRSSRSRSSRSRLATS